MSLTCPATTLICRDVAESRHFTRRQFTSRHFVSRHCSLRLRQLYVLRHDFLRRDISCNTVGTSWHSTSRLFATFRDFLCHRVPHNNVDNIWCHDFSCSTISFRECDTLHYAVANSGWGWGDRNWSAISQKQLEPLAKYDLYDIWNGAKELLEWDC